MSRWSSPEQRLIDATFSLVLTMKDGVDNRRDWVMKASREDLAAWVAEQLKQCGFPTTPCGASWGVLVVLAPESERGEVYSPRRSE